MLSVKKRQPVTTKSAMIRIKPEVRDIARKKAKAKHRSMANYVEHLIIKDRA